MYSNTLGQRVVIQTVKQKIVGLMQGYDSDGYYEVILEDGSNCWVKETSIVWVEFYNEEQSDDE